MTAARAVPAVAGVRDNGRAVSEETTIYLIAVAAGVLSLAAWLWWIVVPALRAYGRWWERAVAVALSVYVLAALVLAGVGLGAAALLYTDKLG